MRRELVCPRCGGVAFWHIGAIQEHGANFTDKPLAVELTAARPMAWRDLFDRPSKDYEILASGSFELLVCEGCNHVEWYARGVDGAHFAAEPFACPACGGAQAWRVDELDERTGKTGNDVAALPVLTTISGSDGHYALAICCACGYTAFTARDLQAVTEHRHGVTVSRLDGDARAAAAGGPYR